MLHTKAVILEELGQGEEAKEALKRASAATKIHSESRSGLFHNELDALRPRKTK
jgi:hypothetical protein